ncbi:TPA: helix-turn-helix transcriptional regulator [Stenotrophomonas maltophilia]|nr:helix-turn-helix transcriptional regulator [Stenotrophomonas maltophilia]
MNSIAFMTTKAPEPTRESRILAAAVEESGQKKKDIADAAGVSPAELYQWATARRPVPAERAATLARVLGIEDPSSISIGYAEIAASTDGALALASAPSSRASEVPSDLSIARLQNDVHALSLALGALTTVMVAHRPAEAQDVASALRRNVPAKFRDRGLIQELIQVLEKKR